MLKKLIKHGFEATRGMFLLLYGITAVLTLLCRALFYIRLGEIPDMSNVYISGWVLWYVLVLIIGISSTIGTILSAVRYYQSMTGDEAYLTFTLPVTTSQIIWSKVLVGFVWNMGLTILSLGCATLAFVGTPAAKGMIPQILASMQEAGGTMQELVPSGINYGISLIASIFVSMLFLMCIVAIGQMFGKYRLIGTIGTYFVAEGVLSGLVSVIVVVCTMSSETMVGITGNSIGLVISSQQMDLFLTMFQIVYQVVLGVSSACLLHYIFKKRLNLE